MSTTINPKPTLIDFVILGLIQNQPHTGYQIRKIFETTALGSQSKSPGTIYPALKRLQKLGFVEIVEQVEKTKYQITIKGIENLIKWLTKPIEVQDVEGKRDELFLRFAFMGRLVVKDKIVAYLTNYQNLLTSYIEKRQTYLVKNKNDMPLTAKLAFEYGTDCQILALKWCNKSIKEFNKQNHGI